ncbi:hypothetical protein Plec18167_002023 [Paecilomyces lecythidis]|uniref:HD domain-containing protein n=1 Tax=Paecilomyces lecythidis TaxID=3004212 RepID=A0ABR3Y934_9EURO
MSISAVDAHAHQTVSQLFDILIAQGDGSYIGEPLSQLEHSLQCAHLARQDPNHGHDDEVVLAALLHDVGRFIPAALKMEKLIAPDGSYVGRASHDLLGEQYLRDIGYSEKVAQLVGAHVMAKRYLTAVDKAYYDALSASSKKSLVFQGGVFDERQVKDAQQDPLLQQKLAIRRWDDQAKVPNLEVPPLSPYYDTAVKCLLESTSKFTLHSREYHLPRNATVAVCIDGFDPEYLEEGIRVGHLPTLQSFVKNGFHTTADSAMPSFTNPNNVSIITGAPPAVHGIAGNFFLDRETGEEKMIVDDTLLRGSTILEQASKRGVRVAAITAKDKLRRIIGHGLDFSKCICFSAERANSCTRAENGIEDVEQFVGRPAPSQYSADLSLFVLDAGIRVLEENQADLLYLTLSDYVQHKYPPGSKEADEFLQNIDSRLQKLAQLAPVVGVTGDHGMSNKSNSSGEPNVLFLEDELSERFGPGAVRVICPITDPFVRHHGALGSFVRVYIEDPKAPKEDILDHCRSLPHVETALSGKEAAETFEMPLDREGDIVVISKGDAVIGSSRSKHDLSKIGDHPLRSHGGLSERAVPLVVSKQIRGQETSEDKVWKNYDIFDLVLNCQ